MTLNIPIGDKPLHTTPTTGDKLLATRAADGATVNIPIEDTGHPAQLRAVRGQLNVREYGAAGDGTTDDGAALAAAISAAVALRDAGKSVTLVFPDGAGYAVTAGVAIPWGIDVRMDAPLIGLGTGDYTVLTVGTMGNAPSRNRRYKLQAVRASQSTWGSTANTALRLVNLAACHIDIVRAEGATVGVWCVGDGDGFAYNQVHLGSLIDNRQSLILDALNGGWCNENVWHGGHFGLTSGRTVAPWAGVERVHLTITSGDGSYTNNNGNKFYGPSFEAYTPSGGTTVCCEIVYGAQNVVHDARAESVDVVLRTRNDAALNAVSLAYYLPRAASNLNNGGGDDLALLGARSSNRIAGGTLRFAQQPLRPVVVVPDVAALANHYDATQVALRQTLTVTASASATPQRAATGLRVLDDALVVGFGVSRAVGCFLDTRRAKEFVATRAARNGAACGRWLVRCYDSAGALLGDGYLTSDALNSTLAYTAGWLGYRNGADGDTPLHFAVASAVASVFVGVTTGTAAPELQSFAVHTSAPFAPRAWAGHGLRESAAPVVAASPTRGVWALGGPLWLAAPVAGGTPGYVVTAAGGASEATWAATTAYSLGAWTRTAGGKVLECTAAGTSGASEPAPTTLGATITDGTVTWAYRSATSAVFKALASVAS